LDEGARVVCEAIAANTGSALSVLYLESNGLTWAVVPAVCNMVRSRNSKIKDVCLGCNRIGDKGATMLADVMDRLEHLELSSCGIGPKGAEAIATVLATNTTLKKLDLGLLKSTNALGEIPNAMGNQGATALAGALTRNSTLLSLNLLHNGIYQQGVSNLAKALTDGNRTLLYLNIEQLGIPVNELTRETIRAALKQNMMALTAEQREAAMAAINRQHLAEIKSVYRNE
jgi:Ran GTPase-activating protein (RanGAP) involved in mRNA processing and transport